MRKKQIAGIFFCLFFLVLNAAPPAFSQEEDLTLEELSKTEAAKLYVTKQYLQSLEEFKKLEAEHPRSVVIKRYIASLYDALRRWDEAVTKLKEALAMDPNDFISRQLLGDIYIKQAELENARQEFETLVSKDKEGSFGKYGAKKLEEIKQLTSMPTTQEGSRLAVQDFMKSKPAQDFAHGKYDDALKGFNELLTQYPDDILIHRFLGITQLRMGKKEEAILTFQEALKQAPDNVALHFYLGQAYLETKKMEEARKEFQWVIAHDETTYKLRAQRAIFQTLGQGAAAGKRLGLNIIQGIEFDSNATYKSSDRQSTQAHDPEFTSAGDQNSMKFTTTATSTYRLFQKRKWTFTGDALYAQTLYEEFPNLQTFTYGGGISALYGFSLFSKPAYLNIREGATHTFLKNKFYVFSNSLSTSLIYIPHKRLRNTATYRFGYSEYQNNGTVADLQSRDGFTNAYTLANTFYFNDKRNLYLNLNYDYERGSTHGVNYIKDVHGVTSLLHFPVLEKIEGEATFKFKDSYYPKFSATGTTPSRRDDQLLYTFQLTRPLGKYFSLSVYYTRDITNAEHNQYQYRKFQIGSNITYKY